MDDLTPQECAVATERGWGLFYVYDQERTRWLRTALPTPFQPNGVAMVQQQLVSMARMNDSLSIKALQLMSQFNTRTQ